MQRIRFHLYLGPEDCLDHYRGLIQEVQVTADDGRRIRFPANLLRPHLSRAGVQGRFELTINEQFKAQGLKRIA